MIKDTARPGRQLLKPRRFAQMLSTRGVLFVKVGQFLATRPDLIPQEYCDELLKLTDQVEPFPWPRARRIIEQDLHGSIETHFAWINQHPIASASLSQVHQARTRDGTEVAVKVQREGVVQTAQQQLRQTGWIIRLLELAGALPGVRAADLSRELSDWLIEELDFRRELSKLTRMHAELGDDPRFRVPQPYPEHSGDRVLVAEYLPGVPFSELLALTRRGQQGRIAQLGFDANMLARNLIDGLLDQIFRKPLFHADPHPGNLLAMEGNVVGFVDFGLVQVLDQAVRRRQSEYTEAVYSADPDRIYRALLDVLEPDKDADFEHFRSELSEATRAWVREAELYGPTRGDGRSPIASYMINVLRAARRNHLHLPQSALAVYRAILAADSIANALGSPGELTRVGQHFFRRLRIERAVDGLMPESVGTGMFEILTAVTAVPTQLTRLLDELAEGRYVLQVRNSDSSEDRRDTNLRTRLVAAAVISVGLAVLVTGQLLHGARSLVLWPLVGLLIVSYAWVALLWRRLR